MRWRNLFNLTLLILTSSLLFLLLSGCLKSKGNEPAKAIEAYYQALVSKDANQLSNLSCAKWEDDAKNELNSFGAVTATLEGMECQETGKEGETSLVSCNGKISASYNGELLEINLADQTYKAVYEGGEWRMCGYH